MGYAEQHMRESAEILRQCAGDHGIDLEGGQKGFGAEQGPGHDETPPVRIIVGPTASLLVPQSRVFSLP